MKKFKEFTNYLKLGALGGIMTFLPYCTKDPITQDNPNEINYEFVSHNNLAENLEFPSGLSYNLKNVKLLKSADNLSGIFIESPLFKNYWSNGGIQIYRNPIISQFTDNLSKSSVNSFEDLNIVPLSEIPLSVYSSDFNSILESYSLQDSLTRFSGVVLDGLILSDGKVLSSVSSSDKIFQNDGLGGVSIYLQDPNLKRITDMIQGKDGKIYAAQVQLMDNYDSSKVIIPKRVISIENGLINTEFEFPSDVNSHFWYNHTDHIPYWWREAPFVERLNIVENSDLGKKNYEFDFIVSDLLAKRIYGIYPDKNVKIIAEDLAYPTSVNVDSLGNIIYTTSPIWKGGYYSKVDYPTSVYRLNPSTGESTLIYSFNENVIDYISTGGILTVGYNSSTRYQIPVNFTVSNFIIENGDTSKIFLSNSHQGNLEEIVFTKSPVKK